MINNIDDFKNDLISSGLVEGEHQLVGCTSEELIELEKKYGFLPTSYKQIMGAIGRRAGTLMDRGEFIFYIDQVSKMNE